MFRLPFNWETAMGYLTAFSMQAIIVYNINISSPCQLSFLAGSCEMLITFARDLQAKLVQINEIIEFKSERNQLKLTQKLHEFIQTHSEIKR